VAKFAVGDTVAKDKDHCGKVAAIFTTFDGEPRYAVEHEGELWFIVEKELALSPQQPKARA
jgi:hypothetical protein